MDHFRKGRLLRWQKVLLFQCENEREIRQILTPMKIQAGVRSEDEVSYDVKRT